jgi:hypothetical protein
MIDAINNGFIRSFTGLTHQDFFSASSQMLACQFAGCIVTTAFKAKINV